MKPLTQKKIGSLHQRVEEHKDVFSGHPCKLYSRRVLSSKVKLRQMRRTQQRLISHITCNGSKSSLNYTFKTSPSLKLC